MMYKEKSRARRKFRALALVPMLTLALGVASVPAVRATVSTISNSSVSVSKDSENAPKDKTLNSKFKLANINNNGKVTIITLKGNDLGDNLSVSGGTFTNDDRTYNSNSMECNLTDGVAVIKTSFPFTDEIKNGRMTIIANGQNLTFDLDDFIKNARTVVFGNDPDFTEKSTIIINGNSSPSIDDMKVLLDGKVIDYSEIKNLPTDKIVSMTVDKEKNEIRITTK